MPRILITGSRKVTGRATVSIPLTQAWKDLGAVPTTVVHGTAAGADSLAGRIARENPGYLVEEPHPAVWRPNGVYNPAAGFVRNKAMVDLGADLCLAFLKRGELNKGTLDCIRRATKAGIEVREYWEEADVAPDATAHS